MGSSLPAVGSGGSGSPSLESPEQHNRGAGLVWVLAAGTFAVGTDAFVVAGILGPVSRSLQVTVGQAGQLVTVFALAYAVLSPVLATVTGTWPRRRVLLVALWVFVLGNVATALAPTFGLVLATRVVAAAGATLVTPQSSVAAASLVPPERRTRAIAVATSGLTVATALGAPLGTAIGAVLGWRGTMWFVAALGAAAAVAIWKTLPHVPNPPALSVRQRLAPLTDRSVLMVLATTLVGFTGVYLIYTYVSVVFAGATGSQEGLLALLLFLFGASATGGNLLAGSMADRIGSRTVVSLAAAALTVICLVLPIGGAYLPSAVCLMILFGLTSFSLTGPQQSRLMALKPDSTPLVVSLNASFLYLAVTLSGVLGGLIVGFANRSWLGPTATVFFLITLALSEFAYRLSTNTHRSTMTFPSSDC